MQMLIFDLYEALAYEVALMRHIQGCAECDKSALCKDGETIHGFAQARIQKALGEYDCDFSARVADILFWGERGMEI